MESGGAEGKRKQGADEEDNIYLIPSEILVLLISGYSGMLTLGNGKQRPRARRENRGCWVGVCLTLPTQNTVTRGSGDGRAGSALSGLGCSSLCFRVGVQQPIFPPCHQSDVLTPRHLDPCIGQDSHGLLLAQHPRLVPQLSWAWARLPARDSAHIPWSFRTSPLSLSSAPAPSLSLNHQPGLLVTVAEQVWFYHLHPGAEETRPRKVE